MGNAGCLRRLSDATGDLVDDYVVVGGVSTQQAAEADDGVIFPGLGEGAGRGGDFESAGHANDLDMFLSRSGAQQPIKSALQQSLGDEAVEARKLQAAK